jgi:hypothetical protein
MPQFPVPVPEIHDAERGVAVWQNEAGVFESGSVDDFVEARRERLDHAPHDPAAQLELGRAYLWSGDAESALDTLAPLHGARPFDREVQSLLLDALTLLDRAPGDYPWVEPPILVPLDDDLMDRLHDLLSRGRRPATVLDLCLTASEGGHPTFDAGELLGALRADDRFLVHPSNLAPECAVVLGK